VGLAIDAHQFTPHDDHSRIEVPVISLFDDTEHESLPDPRQPLQHYGELRRVQAGVPVVSSAKTTISMILDV
jgi:hypothetical protein